MLALTETKFKGREEASWCGVNGIIAGVQEMERDREGVAVLLNDLWHSTLVKSGYVSSRILWMKFKFSKNKVCMVVGYGPNEGDGEKSVGNGYRLCILGDLNGWIGDGTGAGITGAFGVPRENDNGRRVVEFCAERGLCLGNTYFKHGSLHKYTRVARGQDGAESKSMIDLVLLKKDMLRYVQNVRAVRRMGRDPSNHHVLLCKVRLVGA